jgi:hypothetical protein
MKRSVNVPSVFDSHTLSDKSLVLHSKATVLRKIKIFCACRVRPRAFMVMVLSTTSCRSVCVKF